MPLEDRKQWPIKKRGPGWFQDLIDDVYEKITEVQPLSGIQTNVSQTVNGRQVDWVGGGGGGGGAVTGGEFPFEIVSRTNPDNPDIVEIGVVSNSHVFNSEDRDTYEEPNYDWGLLDDDQLVGWVTWPGLGSKIYLQIQLNQEDQSILSIDLVIGSPWDQYPDPVHINTDDPQNPYQDYFFQIIGEVTDFFSDPRPAQAMSADGNEQVTQLLTNNLMMTTARTTDDADQPGVALLVGMPWYGPGTDTGGSADEIDPEFDLMTPWQFGSTEEENHYNFEMTNASDEDGPKVLIYDGVVYGPNEDSGIDPAGMPSDDNYVLDVEDDQEVFLGITWDLDNARITSVWIDVDDVTPDNGSPDSSYTYITIGHTKVNYPDDMGGMSVVFPHNETCGDVVIEVPPSQDVSEDVPELVLVQDTDDGTIRWLETVECECSGGTGNVDGGGA